MAELAPGDLLDGKYRITRLLGSGGMGAVYAAQRVTLGDTVAIKCILDDRNTEENRQRFVREARAAARIRHPNVVQVYDFGIPERGAPYMVMEFLDGPTLSQVLKAEERLPIDHALEVFADVCSAVEAGHRRGVVHRDIKPGNVMLAYGDDEREPTKVLDFGLARLVTEVVPDDLSRPGALLGTVAYMAPEQVADGRVTPSCDVFALAVLLYEMLTGELPFRAANQVATLLRISQGDHDPIQSHRPEVPAALAEAVAVGLAVDPADRPRSPEDLGRLAGAPIKTTRPRSRTAASADPGATTFERSGGRGLRQRLRAAEDSGSSGSTRRMRKAGPKAEPDASLFFGRSEALEALQSQFDAVLSGSDASPTLIVGEAGVGKTRLLDEWVQRLRRRNTTVVRGRFFAYAGDRPPPLEAMQWILASADSSGTSRAQPGANTGAPHDKWQAFASMAEQFVAKARERPLVVALDDLQWASEVDLEFLAYLPHAARPHPVAIVGTARPRGSEELRRWRAALSGQLALRMIELETFSDAELRAWLDGAFGRIQIRPRDVRRIHHSTGGNPFAVWETLRRLVTSGKLVRSDEAWVCDDLFDVGLPQSVQAHVQARISEVAADVRATLDVACVVGEEFRVETVAAAAGTTEDEVERQLQTAAEQGLVSERGLSPGADFRFALPGLRDVLYDAMSPRVRTSHHRRVVVTLGRLYASYGDRLAHLLAYHYDAIADWPATLQHALVAARQTLDRHDNDAAHATLVRARRAANELAKAGTPPTAEQQAQLQYLEGSYHTRVGRVDEAAVELERAADAASGAGASSLKLDVLLALAECHLGQGNFADGVEAGMRAIGAAQALGDRAREFEARVRVARCAGPLGRIDDAEETLAPVLASTDDAAATTRALALRELAWILAKRGAYAQAEKAAIAAAEQARLGQDALAEYRAISVLGLVKSERGDYAAAVGDLLHALSLARALSLRRREGIELGNLGEAYHLAGDTPAGLEHARKGLAIFREIGDLASEGDCRVNVGRMLAALGREEEAEEMLDEGRRACAKSGRLEYEAIAMFELAKLKAVQGEAMAARTLFEQAGAQLHAIASPLVWEAEFGLAQTCLTLGLPERAHDHADQARRIIESQLAALPPGAQSVPLRRAHVLVSRLFDQEDVTRTQV